MGKTRKKKSEDFFDKIVDQGLSLLLAFFFSTALIGGCGYLFFEFPKELLALDNQIVELDIKTQNLSTFNEMLDIVQNGWMSHPDEYSREKDILSVLSNDMNALSLDATFKSESVDWLTSAISQLSKERGQIAGLNIIGEEERNLQVSLLRQYDLNIVSLQYLSDMIFRWEVETFTEKDSRLAAMQDSSLKSLSNLSMITTQLTQLKTKLDTEKTKG